MNDEGGMSENKKQTKNKRGNKEGIDGRKEIGKDRKKRRRECGWMEEVEVGGEDGVRTGGVLYIKTAS